MTTPIRHKSCGEIVMYYVGKKSQQVMASCDIVYLDGTRPATRSAIPACPHCGRGMGNLRRCFDEDVDPGFDINEAVKFGKKVYPTAGPPDPFMMAMLIRQRTVARTVLTAIIIGFGFGLMMMVALWK